MSCPPVLRVLETCHCSVWQSAAFHIAAAPAAHICSNDCIRVNWSEVDCGEWHYLAHQTPTHLVAETLSGGSLGDLVQSVHLPSLFEIHALKFSRKVILMFQMWSCNANIFYSSHRICSIMICEVYSKHFCLIVYLSAALTVISIYIWGANKLNSLLGPLNEDWGGGTTQSQELSENGNIQSVPSGNNERKYARC